MRFTRLLLICLLISLTVYGIPTQSFSHAKKIAAKLFQAHPETLYCHCRFDKSHRIDLASCNMKQAKFLARAHCLEWEHMIPAENFGRQFACWREPLCTNNQGKLYKGRKCCEKIDERFRQAEAELYNLWPAVGAVNQARSNYRYAVLDSTQGFYGLSLSSSFKYCPAKTV